jgi:hypothetical protein
MADVEAPTAFIALCMAAERKGGNVTLHASFGKGEALRRSHSLKLVVEVREQKFSRVVASIDALALSSRGLLMDLAERKFL